MSSAFTGRRNQLLAFDRALDFVEPGLLDVARTRARYWDEQETQPSPRDVELESHDRLVVAGALKRRHARSLTTWTDRLDGYSMMWRARCPNEADPQLGVVHPYDREETESSTSESQRSR